MSHDDRNHDQTPPHGTQPEARADAREQAQAASFAALIDRLTSGQPLPPAMTAEERELVETAGMVRASARDVALAPERQRAVIDSVLDSVLDSARDSALARGPAAARSQGGADAGRGVRQRVPSRGPGRDEPRHGEGDVVDIAERRRGRYFHALPWAVAVLSAAAALLVFWQSRSGPLVPDAPDVIAGRVPVVPLLDETHRSRPADALIGEIARVDADAARARIDVMYADRLIGYRDLRLRGDRL